MMKLSVFGGSEEYVLTGSYKLKICQRKETTQNICRIQVERRRFGVGQGPYCQTLSIKIQRQI